MKDCFGIPLYFFCFICIASFCFIFFTQTSIIENDINILPNNNTVETFNSTSSFFNIFHKDNKKLFLKFDESCSEETAKVIINDEYLQKTHTYNIAIKNGIFIAFGIVILLGGCFIFCQIKIEYDEEQNWDFVRENLSDKCHECCCHSFYSFINDRYDKCWVNFIITITIINLLISAYFITFSILSVVNYDLFSDDILNKCGLIYGKDYNIEGWEISNILIMVVLGLYGTAFILCLISLISFCFCFSNEEDIDI